MDNNNNINETLIFFFDGGSSQKQNSYELLASIFVMLFLFYAIMFRMDRWRVVVILETRSNRNTMFILLFEQIHFLFQII